MRKRNLKNITIQYFVVLITFVLLGYFSVSVTNRLLINLTEKSLIQIKELSSKNITNELKQMNDIVERLAKIEIINDSNISTSDKVSILTKF